MHFEGLGDSTSRARPLEPGAVVGRYVIGRVLGSGGMGVVHEAEDPDLGRRVAIKLLHPSRADSSAGLARLVREAQAMARVSDPHVVTVHDVGEHEGGVFIAMELVDGQTLAAWLRAHTPSWTEAWEVLRQAGRGLEAVHACRLLHRDVKPDNIMVGDDGRTRLMDFGLVRQESDTMDTSQSTAPRSAGMDLLGHPLTREGAIVGTPRYMAPEQLRGLPLTAAADQFSWCATAYEAFLGTAPFRGDSIQALDDAIVRGELQPPAPARHVPAFVRRALARGLAPNPSDRWPDMHSLLAALDPKHRSRRRGVISVSMLLGTVGVSWSFTQWDARRRATACEREGAEISAQWDVASAAVVGSQLSAVDLSYAQDTATRVTTALDDWSERWSSTRTQLCRAATVDATLSETQWTRARECLDDARAEFGEFVAVLREADAKVVSAAALGVTGFQDPTVCTDIDRLAARPHLDRDSTVELRQALARSEAHAHLGDYARARDEAEAAAREAERLGADPLRARAQRALGVAMVGLGDVEEGTAALQLAFDAAARAGDDEVAADVAMQLVYPVGSLLSRPKDGLQWARTADAHLDRAAAPAEDARRFLVDNSRATIIEDDGRWDEAVVLLRETVAGLERTAGADHPETAQALHNLGILEHMVGNVEAGAQALARALEAKSKLLGPEHPEVATTMVAQGENLGALGRKEEAEAVLRRALEIRERALGRDSLHVAHALYTLAHVVDSNEERVSLLERALEINTEQQGPRHPDVAMVVAELGIAAMRAEDYTTARDHFARALELVETELGQEHPLVAQEAFNLGRALEELGEFEAARAALERAAELAGRVYGDTHPFTSKAREGHERLVRAMADHAEDHANAKSYPTR